MDTKRASGILLPGVLALGALVVLVAHLFLVTHSKARV